MLSLVQLSISTCIYCIGDFFFFFKSSGSEAWVNYRHSPGLLIRSLIQKTLSVKCRNKPALKLHRGPGTVGFGVCMGAKSTQPKVCQGGTTSGCQTRPAEPAGRPPWWTHGLRCAGRALQLVAAGSAQMLSVCLAPARWLTRAKHRERFTPSFS